ncbi:MAG TPA: hypothetical protein PKD10_00055 [Paracoccaceae bacterium]|nr:hypothetical protein [Paracoccaceae bacterium]HMO70037.1 hypothetical protein [Paracoccaceae bacterium]
MPNTFAYVMLFAWPLVALVLFQRLPLPKALIWTILGGFLILPSNMGIKLPMIPEINKALVPSLSAAVLCLIYAPRQAPTASPSPGGRMLILGLLVLLVLSPVLTVLQNAEPIPFGPRILPGLRLYDAFSMISGMIVMILPFLLGWRHLATAEAQRMVLQAFVLGALAYSLPALFEIRMSPQLNNWVYGYFPHSFIQHIRAGGFRPLVFLNHGLMLGTFLAMAILAALALWRQARREGGAAGRWLLAAVWLAMTLVLSKNVGALVITLALAPLVALTGARLQLAAAAVIACIVLCYPVLRGAGLVPVEDIHEIALSFSEERAQSLKFRLDNEDALLDHANRKPFSGWGSWGRNMLFDPETGGELSVLDGMWVILIGVYGWPGYLAHFGLLTLPILMMALRRRRFAQTRIVPGLALVLGVTLIDLLPNAGLVAHVWLIAGALAGHVLQARDEAAAPPTATPAPGRRRPPAEPKTLPAGPRRRAPPAGAAALPRRRGR